MEYNFLSLDTSSSCTGWAFFSNGKNKQYGLIDRAKIKDSHERLKQMVKDIYMLINYYSPDCIVIETPVVVRNPAAQRLLTTIYGAVYGKCVFDDIDFADLRPSEWRKLIDSGKKPRDRDGLKQWALDKANELFDVDCATDDIADALLIGQAYINSFETG